MARTIRYERAPKVNAEDLQQTSERVILIRRVAKVTAGGKHLRFNALVALGDGQGHVGIGMGKADAVPDAVRKGVAIARRSMIRVPLKGTTLPHEVSAKYSSSEVLLRPAVPGTGVVAGATVRAIVELVGVQDILSKALGNTNPVNLAKAVMECLVALQDPQAAVASRKPPTLTPPPSAQGAGVRP
ncbi:MAG: 30S ribosomal protein S5 [Chloroflexi bacterium]|nr:30S ribosomal protein S5 [Chloroflexota bacterium]